MDETPPPSLPPIVEARGGGEKRKSTIDVDLKASNDDTAPPVQMVAPLVRHHTVAVFQKLALARLRCEGGFALVA